MKSKYHYVVALTVLASLAGCDSAQKDQAQTDTAVVAPTAPADAPVAPVTEETTAPAPAMEDTMVDGAEMTMDADVAVAPPGPDEVAAAAQQAGAEIKDKAAAAAENAKATMQSRRPARRRDQAQE